MRLAAAALLCGVLVTGAIWVSSSTWESNQTIDLERWQAERRQSFEHWHLRAEQKISLPVSSDSRLERPGPVELWESPAVPQMVVVPPGAYQIGSPPDEVGRFPDEGPQIGITIDYAFAVGKYPVTRGEYAYFVQDSGYVSKTECYGYAGETELKKKSRFTWLEPGFRQQLDEPVVCIGWNDAKAYVDWLSRKTGEAYRLLSEAEWEYGARSGTGTAHWWGESRSLLCDAGNGADLTAKTHFTDWEVAECEDGALFTSPVGKFSPNLFGLFDMYGNVWEWVEDCGSERYGAGAPVDGHANLTGDCGRRMMRGGSWHSNPRYLRSATRRSDRAEWGYAAYGIRVARDLGQSRIGQ